MKKKLLPVLLVIFNPIYIFASESNLKIPTLNDNQQSILIAGLFVCVAGLAFGMYQYLKVKRLKAHK